ncbi:MAG: sensor histidine kinase [Dinoroseobacter sp.]|nr:sensor histidine kinase [Dinoroseobacter sp.]
MSLATDIDRPKGAKPAQQTTTDVVLGEDWVAPKGLVEDELRVRRERRGTLGLNKSPLARKIVTFNLLALVILVAGVLYLNPFRDSLVLQREQGLFFEAQLVADVFEAQLEAAGASTAVLAEFDTARTIEGLDIASSVMLTIYDAGGTVIAQSLPGASGIRSPIENADEGATVITDFLGSLWSLISGVVGSDAVLQSQNQENPAEAMLDQVLAGETAVHNALDANGAHVFAVATPIEVSGAVIGAVALTTASGEIDQLVQREREQVLQMFFVALLVSIGLSLVLASTIANPLSDLAAAAELGRDKNARTMSPGRVRIPDLTARPDEIGRLSGALRGMVSALYDRIDANEQFAADVAHEIKNPLASLRSATGTLRKATRDDQRERLLDVIQHDVKRLDRLVSDISNASRLDSELVREEEAAFDLLHMLNNLVTFHRQEAEGRGIDFISDMPEKPIRIQGLEPRLAQVFVNLLTNAISFCEAGDAVRIWVRQRDNRVLVVVEDTGPGIPHQALTKIFTRFYSERPENQFGDHSGLGLAISKQIIEAHGGVIWAENILPTRADPTSEPLGARFVVGLPI